MVLQAMQVVQVVQETTVALVDPEAQEIMEILAVQVAQETTVAQVESVVQETTVLSVIQEMLVVQAELVDLRLQSQQFLV
jgi:hypothetical protein